MILNKNYKYAVVGVSRSKDKYGYQVFADLLRAGYNVLPINPQLKKVLGIKAFPSLSDLPYKPDVVVMVVPPLVTKKILSEVEKLGIKNIWLQPGSESRAAIEFCKQKEINCIHNACIMIERKKR